MTTNLSRRRAIASTGAVLFGTALAGCSGDGDDDTESPTDQDDSEGAVVEMTDDLVFDPETVTIGVGETVTWENVGAVGHSVTAYEDEIPDGAEYFASGGFEGEQAARDAYTAGDPESGDILEGETYEHTFETAGSYEYFCIPHEGAEMVGTVEVEA